MLGHLIVGELAQSELYVKLKLKACDEVGIGHRGFHLPSTVDEQELQRCVQDLKEDPSVNGVLIQLPLPARFDQERLVNMIGPEKDVDGLHPFNIGSLALKRHSPYFVSCTPLGVVKILEEVLGSKEAIAGKRVLIIGRSNIVGQPLYLLLNNLNAFCRVAFSLTPTAVLESYVREAEIVIAACGQPQLVRADWIRPNAIVIDVGINFVN